MFPVPIISGVTEDPPGRGSGSASGPVFVSFFLRFGRNPGHDSGSDSSYGFFLFTCLDYLLLVVVMGLFSVLAPVHLNSSSVGERRPSVSSGFGTSSLLCPERDLRLRFRLRFWSQFQFLRFLAIDETSDVSVLASVSVLVWV